MSNAKKQISYIAVPASNNTLKIVNAATGGSITSIVLKGELIGNPIVSGDIVSVVIKDRPGHFLGRTYKLPNGSQLTQYSL